MGLLRTDILVRFPFVSVSFYARNATKTAFVLGLGCWVFFYLRALSGARNITQEHRFTLKQSAAGSLSKLIKVWFEFLSVCMCLCVHTYARNLLFSLYSLAHSEGILLHLIPPSPPKDEKVATWYPSRLLFEHFSLTTKNLACSEIALNIWLPPEMKEIAATQGRCRQVQYSAHSSACLGGDAAECLGINC